MKLSCGVPVFHIWEDRVKAHLVLCLSTSLFTVLTVHCGEDVLSQEPSFCLYFCNSPALFSCLFALTLCVHFFLLPIISGTQIWMRLAAVFYRNSACVCFPSQTLLLAPTSMVCKFAHTLAPLTELHAAPVKPRCSCQFPSTDVMLPVIWDCWSSEQLILFNTSTLFCVKKVKSAVEIIFVR